jgi:Na+/phosphate symporter
VRRATRSTIEGSAATNPATRRLRVGKMINRVVGIAIALPLLPPIASMLSGYDLDPARFAADSHTAFNLALALAFLPLLDPLAARSNAARSQPHSFAHLLGCLSTRGFEHRELQPNRLKETEL